MRGNERRFISNDRRRRLERYATSGSTGHPLIFYYSNDRFSANRAAYLLLYNIWGLKIGDREAVLWGSSRDVSAYSIAKQIRDNLLNTRLLPAFRLNEEIMRKYIAFIQKYRPKDIFGYAHSIYLLARFAKNRGLRLDDIGVKVVFTTAELLHDFQRKLIEEVFGCRVSNSYGGRDSGLVAFECPEGGMHLNPNIITEFIKDGAPAGPGEKGEIVITDLESYGMPFIRYKTGDEGTRGDGRACKCGRAFPVIKEVLGRNTDHVVSPKGDLIHPLALEYVFRDIEGVDYFKIIQKKEDELVVEMVINQKFNKNLEPVIMDKIFQVMGQPISVIFRYIKEGDVNKTEDKYKFVVSEIMDKYR